MSDNEEWTVVNSKSRPKKTGTVQHADEGKHCRSNTGQTKRYQPLAQEVNRTVAAMTVGRFVVPLPANHHRLHKREQAFGRGSNAPKTSQGLVPTASNSSTNIASKKDARIQGKKITLPTSANSSATPKTATKSIEANQLSKNVSDEKSKTFASTSRAKFLDKAAKDNVVVFKNTSGTNAIRKENYDNAPSSSKGCSPSSGANVTPKEKCDSVPGGGGATSATVDAPKKKKRKSKDDRRKKREEMFYQALYQNKDSHIQFVSAEVIRKLQNGQKVPAPKPSSTKKLLFPSACTANNQCSDNIQSNFEDFPCLTTTKRNETPQQSLEANVTNNNFTTDIEPSNDKVEVNTEANVIDKGSHIMSAPKSLSSTSTETPRTDIATTPLPTPVASCSKGKKSKQPIIIDVNSLIVSSKKERDVQRKSALYSSSQAGRTGIFKKENFKITAGNPLDSSGPGVINRGKIRQKKKKPTKLKLTILKGRELRRILCTDKSQQNVDKINEIEDDKRETKVDNIDNVCESLADNFEGLATDTNSEEKVEPQPDINSNEESLSVGRVEIKDEEALNKENTIAPVDSDISLKFIKLLDEISMLKITDESLSPQVEIAVKASMHNRKFRDYCDMYTSKALHKLVVSLLSELFRFQDRLYHTDPIKFKTKRRFVQGLKEALCYLNLNKVQLIIMAPDIEKNPEPGGLDEKISQIITLANGKGVPYVFSSTKYNLGKPVKIKTPVSIITVLDKQNCEDTFRALLEEASQLREKYHNDFAMKAKELQAQVK